MTDGAKAVLVTMEGITIVKIAINHVGTYLVWSVWYYHYSCRHTATS